MDELSAIGKIAGSAMQAQTVRMRITAENMANVDTTGSAPGADPYRRKTVEFAQAVDRASGAPIVTVDRIDVDPSAFETRYDPSHPAANDTGYVKMPNVNAMVEMANMREAMRSYEANLNMMDSGRRMRVQLLDMLKK